MSWRRLSVLLLTCVFATLAEASEPIEQGPFIGHVSHDSATIWARAAVAGAFVVHCREHGTDVAHSARALASPQHDGCMTWRLERLKPGTRYDYSISPAAEAGTEALGAATSVASFRTAPAPGQPARVTIAFGSCAKEDDGTARTWRRIGARDVDVMVLLGDTPYIDTTDLQKQRERYRAFASVTAMQDVLRSTAWYGTWDDHDFGRNDTDGRLDGKERSRQAFIEYHANPSAGDGREGVYTSFRHGPVEVFLLDTRYFAATEPSPFAADRPTLLGRAQWAWLKEGLATSDAPFKILACGMIWNGAVRPNKQDHWGSYPHERQALFEWIGAHGVPGVVLVGGDIHRSRVLHHDTAAVAGYTIPEYITSPMHDSIIERANQPHDDLVFDIGEPFSFLEITVDDTVTPAVLRASLVNAAGNVVFEETIERPQLLP